MRFLRSIPRICRSNYSTTSTLPDRGPLRIAVLGSGPAGFYTALRAVQKYPNTHVHMYEAQPTPYGLVRYGVAPDHPEVKNCQEKFATLSTLSPSFRFLGNVSIGTDIPLPLLSSAYHAIILSYGASADRLLNIPGETHPNVIPARDFVGWYNSFPLCADKGPRLSDVEDVVVVGQGNVALDVARVLLSDVDQLRGTDMSEAALEELARSRVKSVRIVGRRGVCQGAFQIKEVRELMTLKNVGFVPPYDLDELVPGDLAGLPRQQRRLMELMVRGSEAGGEAARSWGMDFCLSPTRFNGVEGGALESVTFRRNALMPGPFEKDARAVPIEPEEEVTFPAQLAFRSIGYKSIPIPSTEEVGLPFNGKNGTIPNQAGRILSRNEGGVPMPGWYCAGWVKRGPTGVIASTMMDAFDTAETLVNDWVSGKPFLNGEGGWDRVREGMSKEAREKRIVEWDDWQIIEKEEKRRGHKISSLEEMLQVVDRTKGTSS